jgi:hypothetical protein
MTHTKDEALALALEALEKISRTQYHIETPPVESLEEKMRRIADKAITAIKQALAAPTVQEPVGWKLVPIEPTNEMIDAGNDVEDLYRRGTPETWGKVYRAMIRAVPAAQPATEESSETQTTSAYVKTYHGGKPWPLQPAPEKS